MRSTQRSSAAQTALSILQRAVMTTVCMTCSSSSKSPGRTTGSRWSKAMIPTALPTRSSTRTWSLRSPIMLSVTSSTPFTQKEGSSWCSISSSSSEPGEASSPWRRRMAPDPCLRSSPTGKPTRWTSFSPPRTSSRWFPSKMWTWRRATGRTSRCSCRKTRRSCMWDARRWTQPSWTRPSRASWRRRPRPVLGWGSAKAQWMTGSWWVAKGGGAKRGIYPRTLAVCFNYSCYSGALNPNLVIIWCRASSKMCALCLEPPWMPSSVTKDAKTVSNGSSLRDYLPLVIKLDKILFYSI